MAESYTKKEVAAITGIPYRNIQFYTEQGVVVPEVEAAGGRGKFRRYSNRDLVYFLIAGELGFYGMTVSDIKTATVVMSAFWNMNKKVGDQKAVIPDSDVLRMVRDLDFSLLISRNKDRSRVTQLRVGKDEDGEAVVKFSVFTDSDGKRWVHYFNKQDGSSIVLNQAGKSVKGIDPDKMVQEQGMSFIFIGLSDLVKEAMARIS
jgi:hypothetical protein